MTSDKRDFDITKISTFDQFLVLLCLTGFTIASPVLTIFGSEPGIFYFHNVESRQLITLYAILVAFLPTVVLWMAIRLVSLVSKRSGAQFYLLIVAALASCWLLQLLKWNLGVKLPALLVITSIVGGILFTLLYLRVSLVDSWLKVASVSPILIVGFFLISSDSGKIPGKLQTEEYSEVSRDDSYPPVLFLMLDEFPTLGLFDKHGEVDKVRYPNLRELSETATWYRHYTVLTGKTKTSVPSILTGEEPREVVPSARNFPRSLFSLLGPTHHLTVFEATTGLCGLPQCGHGSPGTPVVKAKPQLDMLMAKSVQLFLTRVSPSAQKLERFDDFQEKIVEKKVVSDAGIKPKKKKKGGIASAFLKQSGQADKALKKPDRLVQFVDTFVADKSALYYLHLEMPHAPWRFHHTGEIYDLPYKRAPFTFFNEDGGEWLTRLTFHRFLLQAQYSDRLLGEVFDRLKSLGMWDDTLIIVTADHGRSFKQNTNIRWLTTNTIGSVAYAPLFIKRPGQKFGEINDSNIMAYDIVPTIANILGIDIPWQVIGLPSDDDRIAERGDKKICYLRDSGLYPQKQKNDLGERQSFSDSEQFPKIPEWWDAVLKNPDEPLACLNSSLELDQFIGKSSADFEFYNGGTAIVDELGSLRAPNPEKVPLGIVMGNLEFEPSGDRILVAINGRFVTGSPLITFHNIDNTFIAMLPPSILLQRNQIELFLVEAAGLQKLALSE